MLLPARPTSLITVSINERSLRAPRCQTFCKHRVIFQVRTPRDQTVVECSAVRGCEDGGRGVVGGRGYQQIYSKDLDHTVGSRARPRIRKMLLTRLGGKSTVASDLRADAAQDLYEFTGLARRLVRCRGA